MDRVFAVGVGSTPFRKWPEQSHRELADTAIRQALADCERETLETDGIWFGNCALDVFGQNNIRGQVTLDPLSREGLLRKGTPVINVEGGCATGMATVHGAFCALAAGQADIALAVGVEKTWVPDDPRKTWGLFLQGIDQQHPEEWQRFYAEAGERAGQTFAPDPARIVFLDVHAMAARHHMETYGTTLEQLASIAVKNHQNGQRNPDAQYRFGATLESVLGDRPVVDPFTRSMCSPVSDGSAAVVLVRQSALGRFSPEVRERAVEVRSVALQGGTWRELDGEDAVGLAAKKAYAQAGIEAHQVGIAEVHDCNAWRELAAMELLGFCPKGEGGPYVASGATQHHGARPVNASGGLIARGHPLGATGVGMIDSLVRQLRGEAGPVQVPTLPGVGIAQNAGGMMGFDEALCGMAVLSR